MRVRKAQSRKWSLWGVTLVSAIALQSAIPPIAAQTQPSAAQSAELKEAERLNQQVEQLYEEGGYKEAIPLAQRAIAISEKALGRKHPDVATSLNNLALLYVAQGNYTQAEPLYQRSLDIREKVLEREHPDVGQSINNLAGLYFAQNDIPRAIEFQSW